MAIGFQWQSSKMLVNFLSIRDDCGFCSTSWIVRDILSVVDWNMYTWYLIKICFYWLCFFKLHWLKSVEVCMPFHGYEKCFHVIDIIALTLHMQGPNYSCSTYLISQLLMPWLLASPGHHHPWYWLCRICRFLFYRREDFNHPCPLIVWII